MHFHEFSLINWTLLDLKDGRKVSWDNERSFGNKVYKIDNETVFFLVILILLFFSQTKNIFCNIFVVKF